MAVHRHGCCVLQRCLDAAGPKLRSRLVDEVGDGDSEVDSEIICQDEDQPNNRSWVEVRLASCQPHRVLGGVFWLQVARNGLKLMQDPFGNYVVQYVLKTCSR